MTELERKLPHTHLNILVRWQNVTTIQEILIANLKQVQGHPNCLCGMGGT